VKKGERVTYSSFSDNYRMCVDRRRKMQSDDIGRQ